MSKQFDQEAITAALQQRQGMSEDRAASLSAFNEKQSDWYTTCPRCQQALRGTLAQLREHRCGTEA